MDGLDDRYLPFFRYVARVIGLYCVKLIFSISAHLLAVFQSVHGDTWSGPTVLFGFKFRNCKFIFVFLVFFFCIMCVY